jgi:hypothetical protein
MPDKIMLPQRPFVPPPKPKPTVQLDRPIIALFRDCPTCGAAPGQCCRGGRCHKLMRRTA